MKINIVIVSEQLSKDDLEFLLQSIRDCEQKSFADKHIVIGVFVPELTTEEINQLLNRLKPPLKDAQPLGGKR